MKSSINQIVNNQIHEEIRKLGLRPAQPGTVESDEVGIVVDEEISDYSVPGITSNINYITPDANFTPDPTILYNPEISTNTPEVSQSTSLRTGINSNSVVVTQEYIDPVQGSNTGTVKAYISFDDVAGAIGYELSWKQI